MRNGYFRIEIMILAAHMLASGHAPQRENLEEMCDLVRLGVYSTARIHCPLTRRVHPARALILNI